MPHRTAQQDEQLRALQLERDFQKRAEEAANQQDDDEDSNDLDNESEQRMQGLLHVTTSPERNSQTLARTSSNNQTIRSALSPQPVSSQLQSSVLQAHQGMVSININEKNCAKRNFV